MCVPVVLPSFTAQWHPLYRGGRLFTHSPLKSIWVALSGASVNKAVSMNKAAVSVCDRPFCGPNFSILLGHREWATW